MRRFVISFALAIAAASPAAAQSGQTEADILLVSVDPKIDLGPLPVIEPARIPPDIRRMLDAAIASNNAAEIATLVKYGTQAAPDYGQEIRALAEKWRNDREAQRVADIRGAGPLDLWDGRGEVGGFVTTGNTENTGVSAKVDLTREGLQWRHKLHASADYQESFGIASRERFAAGYEPNFKFDDRRYAYGALLYESDRFLGYDNRFSASAGYGYGLIREPMMTLDVTIGPAYRFTDYVAAMDENGFGGRGSIDFDWRLSSGVKLTQDASAYVDTINSTINATTGLEARVIGPLSARLSYNVQYESNPATARVNTDTISRAALVYDF